MQWQRYISWLHLRSVVCMGRKGKDILFHDVQYIYDIQCLCSIRMKYLNNFFGRVFYFWNFEWCEVAEVKVKSSAVFGFIGSDGTCFPVSYPYFYFVSTRWCLIWRVVMPSCALIWVISNCHAGNTKYHLVICGYIRKLKVVVDSEGNRNHLFPGCP